MGLKKIKKLIIVVLFLFILNNSIPFIMKSQKIETPQVPNMINELPRNFNLENEIINVKNSQKIEQTLVGDLRLENSERKFFDILITFTSNFSKLNRLEFISIYAPTTQILYNYDIIPCLSLRISGIELKTLINHIKTFHQIQYISKNHQKRIENNNPPLNNWSHPFSLENWWVKTIGADKVTYTGKGVKLAIMDTGITVHPDFFSNGNPKQPRIIKSRNFTYEENVFIDNYTYDDYGHGTHCAGIAAGSGTISDGRYRGVATDAFLINAKISNSTGFIREDKVIAAIEWCMQEDVDIISMSFGNLSPEVWTPENMAIKEAVDHGIVVISSAGNDGPNFFSSGSPATSVHSISVGATDINNHSIYFSSIGPTSGNHLIPDICAPGVNIISTESKYSLLGYKNRFKNNYIDSDKNFAYIPLSGTSMSCPMVAGAVALLLEAFPNSSPESIRNALILGANEIERPSPEGYGVAQGAGLLNIPGSLNYLLSLNQSDINNQAKVFPRKIPYSPYDLLKFPGDEQQLNLSLNCGKQLSIELEFPNLEGIQLFYTQTLVNSTTNNIISIPLKIRIQPNASVGTRKGYLKVKNAKTGELYDEILIEITVAFPKGKILFDSYHGLNDVNQLPSSLRLSQIDLYHSMYDLYKLNYSLRYSMEDWTTNYSPWKDGEIISPQSLSEIDILVLQTPILPYSEYEIDAIINYFNNGGSILFLGTLSEMMCVNSINDLFSKLGVGFSVINENLIDFSENSLYSSFNTNSITDINHSSPIFSNVDEYLFKMGNTFNVNSNSSILSTFHDKIIAASYNGKSEGKGVVLGLGDFNTFAGKIYNDPLYYVNHSNFLKNIIESMISSDPVRISTNIVRNTSDIELNINIFNPENQLPIIGLNSPENITCTLIYGNGTNKPIELNPKLYEGEFVGTFSFNSSDATDLLYELKIEVLSQYSSLIYLYFYNSTDFSYTEITLNVDEVIRSSNDPIQMKFTTNGSQLSVKPYIAVIASSYHSRNNMNELSLSRTFGENQTFQLTPSNITLSGGLITYSIINNTDNYYDFTPDRYIFPVKNFAPEINLDDSTFGSVLFSETQPDGEFSPQFISFYNGYEIIVSPYDEEDSIESLTIFASIIPIFTYNRYINFLYPIEIPKYDFTFDSFSNQFQAIITIPENLLFNSKGTVIEKSLETDLVNNFLLLWISVKDKDGFYFDFLILLFPFTHEPNFKNFYPIIIIFSFISLIIILLHKKPGIFLKKN
jgi:serine protease AprX